MVYFLVVECGDKLGAHSWENPKSPALETGAGVRRDWRLRTGRAAVSTCGTSFKKYIIAWHGASV